MKYTGSGRPFFRAGEEVSFCCCLCLFVCFNLKKQQLLAYNPSILISQWSKKLTDGQSSLLLLNQAHGLDGANWWGNFSLIDTRAFLLLNHLEIFSCILIVSNHMILFVQFGINKHLEIFRRTQIALALRARLILLVFKKCTRAYLLLWRTYENIWVSGIFLVTQCLC